MDPRDLDRRALDTAVAIVDRVGAADLDRPTPCAGWTLGRLLAHMIGQDHGFAAAAGGAGPDLAGWQDLPPGDDPGGRFRASAEAVTAAFAADGLLDRRMWVPEIRPDAPLPARIAFGAHVVDTVAHGWDVAKALGVEPGFDADLVDAVLPLAVAVPHDPGSRGPGAAFGPRVDPPAGALPLDRLVALLGRAPDWSPS